MFEVSVQALPAPGGERRAVMGKMAIKTVVRGDQDGWGCQYRNGRVTVFRARKKAESYCASFAGTLVRVRAEKGGR